MLALNLAEGERTAELIAAAPRCMTNVRERSVLRVELVVACLPLPVWEFNQESAI